MKKGYVLICLLLLVFTAACGANNANNASSASGANGGNGQQPVAEGSQGAAESSAAQEKRIVSLSIPHTSNLLALGIKPYGAVTQGGKNFLPHVADMLSGTVNLGSSQEPNLEALVDAAPDLIIGQDELMKGSRETIEKIAPLYTVPVFGELSWRDQLVKLGEELGRSQEAAAFLGEYDAKLAAIKEKVQQTVGEGTVMVLRVMPKELRLYGLDRSYGSLLYQDLGLKPVAGLEKLAEGPEAISRELLPSYDADHILLEVASSDDAQQLYRELNESAIWNGMKAVKAGNIHMIEQQPWLDYSAMGMMKSLELAETLFEKGSAGGAGQ